MNERNLWPMVIVFMFIALIILIMLFQSCKPKGDLQCFPFGANWTHNTHEECVDYVENNCNLNVTKMYCDKYLEEENG